MVLGSANKWVKWNSKTNCKSGNVLLNPLLNSGLCAKYASIASTQRWSSQLHQSNTTKSHGRWLVGVFENLSSKKVLCILAVCHIYKSYLTHARCCDRQDVPRYWHVVVPAVASVLWKGVASLHRNFPHHYLPLKKYTPHAESTTSQSTRAIYKGPKISDLMSSKLDSNACGWRGDDLIDLSPFSKPPREEETIMTQKSTVLIANKFCELQFHVFLAILTFR